MKELRINPASVFSCYGELLYGTKDEQSNSRRAFSHGDILTFSLRLPRQIGATSANVAIRCDATGDVVRFPLVWSGAREDDDIWTCEIDSSTLSIGLHYLRAEFESISGRGIAYRTSNGCGFKAYNEGEFTFQLLLAKFAYEQPSWLLGGVIYQIFVDRFAHSGDTPVREGTILNPDWENGIPQYPEYPGAPLANNMFFGGNLAGIIEKLPYIASLGVTCIYLTPIFRAASNHKYDTGNYMEIDEMFGDEDTLRRLIASAKEQGIRIVLDGVFNHTGDDSLYFNRRGNYPSVGAYQSKDSPYFGWYDFQEHPDRYTSWWNIGILPRINTQNPSCREYFLGKGGVIEHYAQMGIGGFRLDVADELSDGFIAGIKEVLAGVKSDAVLYGEVWEDASNKVSYESRRRYFWGKELDGVMNYELRRGIIHFIRDHRIDGLRYALLEVMPNTPKRVQDIQMNLFGTHDTARILTELIGAPATDLTNAEKATVRLSPEKRALGIKKVECAYLILATVPGIPMIYYGDEIGMEGYNDPFNRMPFAWHKMDSALLAFYRQVGELRRQHKVYRDGAFRLLHLSDSFLSFARIQDGVAYVTLINNSTSEKHLTMPRQTEVLLGGAFAKGKLTLAANSGAVVVLKENQLK